MLSTANFLGKTHLIHWMVGWVEFYDISTLAGYFMPNLIYINMHKGATINIASTSLGEGKLWIQTCQTPLKKKIDLVSYPARAEGLGKKTKKTLLLIANSLGNIHLIYWLTLIYE